MHILNTGIAPINYFAIMIVNCRTSRDLTDYEGVSRILSRDFMLQWDTIKATEIVCLCKNYNCDKTYNCTMTSLN